MSVMCCPLESGDGEPGSRLFNGLRVARKDYRCYECREPIARGSKYECDEFAYRDKTLGVDTTRTLGVDTTRTCLSCVEIRDHFACDGFTYGSLWSDLEDNFFPDMKAGGPCMEGLSPAAKQRLFDRRLAWLERRAARARLFAQRTAVTCVRSPLDLTCSTHGEPLICDHRCLLGDADCRCDEFTDHELRKPARNESNPNPKRKK